MHANTDRFKTAIQAPGEYLLPVCEYRANPPGGATRITMLNEGDVALTGQRWAVTKKVEVEFA